MSSRTGNPLSVKYFIRRDDESAPDSSSGTGNCLSVKVFIRLVQIQPEIFLSVQGTIKWYKWVLKITLYFDCT